MAKNTGKQWTVQEVSQLKNLAKGNTPTRIIALKMGRSPSAIQAKASEQKISLEPHNQSPYNRKR